MVKSGKKKKKNKQKHEEFILDQDEYFYFIAGYTSGELPMGLHGSKLEKYSFGRINGEEIAGEKK